MLLPTASIFAVAICCLIALVIKSKSKPLGEAAADVAAAIAVSQIMMYCIVAVLFVLGGVYVVVQDIWMPQDRRVLPIHGVRSDSSSKSLFDLWPVLAAYVVVLCFYFAVLHFRWK